MSCIDYFINTFRYVDTSRIQPNPLLALSNKLHNYIYVFKSCYSTTWNRRPQSNKYLKSGTRMLRVCRSSKRKTSETTIAVKGGLVEHLNRAFYLTIDNPSLQWSKPIISKTVRLLQRSSKRIIHITFFLKKKIRPYPWTLACLM